MKLLHLSLLALSACGAASQTIGETAGDWRHIPHDSRHLVLDWDSIEGPQSRRSANFATWGEPPTDQYLIVRYDVDCTARTISHVGSASYELTGAQVGTSTPAPNSTPVGDTVDGVSIYDALCRGIEPDSDRFRNLPEFLTWAENVIAF